jgi:signal transduction histidine kinase/CheY-like chemotaxis protein
LTAERLSAPLSANGPGTDVALLCETLNCVAYAFSVDTDGGVTVDWVVGSISGACPVPLRALLAGAPPGGQTAQAQAHLAKLLAGNASQMDLVCRCEQGQSLRVRDSAQPEFNKFGRVARILGTVRDISGELWARQDNALDIWRHRIAEHLDVGLTCWDIDDRLVLVNRAFGGLHSALATLVRPGMSVRTLITAVARSGEIVIDGSRRSWIESTLEDVRNDRAREHALVDGRWLEVTPVHFAEGAILRIQDISSQKGGERALRLAKEVAETANMKKSRFLRAANHDLRQPLATLKILIYSSFDVVEEAKRRDLLHSMDVTVGIMDEILGSLLQIGQLDAGRIATRIVHFQTAQVLERLKIEFGPQAEAKGLKLRVAPSHVTITSDRVLLERILSNFIANAIRFTETGAILVGARRRGSNLEIQVWDTGCGIADDQLALIFEEFHQVANQPSHRQRGLGLGLNIAYRLAELLEHDIDVRSTVGRGSMFSVSVPVGNVWQSDLGEPEISERIGGEFLDVKVLVIEDNELLRRTVCLMLDRWGVKVTESSDGETALSRFADGAEPRPDLVLVDYRLPNGRAGTEVMADLRRIFGQDLPGIVATADTDPTLIARIRAEGLPVLIKPINPARLRSAMHHLLFEQRREPIKMDEA